MDATSLSLGYLILVVAAGLTFLVGFLINVFIVAVNIFKWKKARLVFTADKVIISLGISRIFFLLTCLMNIISDLYSYKISKILFELLEFLEISSVYSSILLSMLLSVVFCLKISTLHNVFFLRLKILVVNRTIHLILATMVVSAGYGLAFSLIATFKFSLNTTHVTYDNVYFGLWVSVLVFLTSVPFLIYFISSVLLIFYLYHHMNRMRSEMNGTSHLDSYYKTIKFTGFSLLGSTFYIMFDQTYPYCYNVLSYLGFYFIWEIFPTLHSMYLIYVSAKLRSQLVHQLKSRCCGHEAQTKTISQQ